MTRWYDDLILPISLLAGLAAVVLLCWRFGLGDFVDAFAQLHFAYLGVYLVLGAAVCLGYSMRWYVVARAVGPTRSLGRFVAARLAGDALGALLPTGRLSGDPLRVALVRADGVAGVDAGAGVAIDRMMEVVGNTLCATAYVTVFSLVHSLGQSRRPAVLLIVTLLGLLALIAMPVEMLRRGRRPLTPLCDGALQRYPSLRPALAVLREIEDNVMRVVRNRPLMVIGGVLGSLLVEGLVIVEYHYLLASFGLVLDLPTLLMALVATGLARVVPTPAGLGALEAGQVSVLTIASGRPDVGFVVGMVLRLHETLWMAAGLVALSAQGFSIARLRLLAAGKSA